MPGPLGWIKPEDRTQAQSDAHEKAVSKRQKYSLANVDVPKGTKLILTDLWKNPTVTADIGMEFPGFHQLTGSCVGVSAGNAIATLSFAQRLLATNPTKAFIPFWAFPYGRTRFNEGDRGQGEGAVDSVMGATLIKEGVFAWENNLGLPNYKTDDGIYITSKEELSWSDGARIDNKYITLAKNYPLGGDVTLNNTNDIKNSILNAYPVLDGCNNYVGNGSIVGSGDNAYVSGHYDGQGGHSTCFLGYWEHPNDGPLFLYSNQWPTSTYPKDPAGGGRCTVWLKESVVAKLFTNGGDNGETMALSHLTYLVAQPKVLDWSLAV